MSRKLFVCCTTYQVFNCINYNIANKKKLDVYDIVICNHFQNAKKIFQFSRKALIWDNCFYMVTEYHRNLFETLKLIRRLDYKGMMKNDCSFAWNYDEVFIGTFNNISSIIAYKYCKLKKAKLTIIDEGIGTYILKGFEAGFPIKQKLLRKILGHIIQPESLNAIFLYAPEYYRGTCSVPIKKLPTITREDNIIINAVNETFQYFDSSRENKSIIIFDQPIKAVTIEGRQLLYKDFLKLLLSHINRIADESAYYIRWHPRTEERLKADFLSSLSSDNSYGGWEVDLLNDKFKKKHIYITIFSSAALLGTFIFDDDDVIIFLYKLISCDVDNLEGILQTMKEKGVQIFIPSNWNEFEIILEESYKLWKAD